MVVNPISGILKLSVLQEIGAGKNFKPQVYQFFNFRIFTK